MKPGVHVHVNSLTNLTDESKPLSNNNSMGNQGTVAINHLNPNTITFGNNEQVNKHHLNYIQALNQQKLYPSSTLDKRSSSSSSSNSSASSSSNLINPRKILSQTLPRNTDNINEMARQNNTTTSKPALTLRNRGEKDYPSSDIKYYHSGIRPNSVISMDKTSATDINITGTSLNLKSSYIY